MRKTRLFNGPGRAAPMRQAVTISSRELCFPCMISWADHPDQYKREENRHES